MPLIKANEGKYKYATREKNPTNEDNMIYYSEDFSTEYIAANDGETAISLDIPVGAKIVQVEREIKPMSVNDWGYNTNSKLLTLKNGVSLSADETLFIIYKIIKTTI